MNKSIEKFTRDKLKALIQECTEEQQHLFKRMYSHKNINLPLDEIINKIDIEKIDWALTQIENTILKNTNLKKEE